MKLRKETGDSTLFLCLKDDIAALKNTEFMKSANDFQFRVFLFLLFQMHALGAGDIKLFSLVGSFLTTKQLFLVMFDSFLFAAVLGMGKVVQLYLSQGGKKERFTKIHFSIEILLAVVYVTGRCVVAKN